MITITGNSQYPPQKRGHEDLQRHPKLLIDVWADVVCPWCYIGEHRLERALEQFPHADRVELRMHTFPLDPSMTDEVMETAEYLARKYNVSVEEARAMDERAAQQAAQDGLPYAPDRPIRSTFDMLRLVHLGNEYGVGWQYMRAMQGELFGGSPAAFERETLIRLGESLGIPAGEIRAVLDSDRFADAVQKDYTTAVQLGATGVPFTVLANRFGIPGATSVEGYARAIARAWEHVNG